MGHFYDTDSNPRHFEGKDGGPTTLREARKLALYPSVTTIQQVVYKFQLEAWKQRQAAMAAAEAVLLSPPEAITDEWANEIMAAATKERMEQTADVGTDMHDALEQYGFDRVVPHQWREMCAAVDDLVQQKTGRGIREFANEQRFCDSVLGYAGQCDLSGHGWVIDYKSKEAADITPKLRGWPDQAEQLAAYAHGLHMPRARLANVFVARSHDGDGPWPVAWFEHSDEYAWDRFRLALELWQVSKKYGPLFDARTHEEIAA